jgi:predicted dehydrogenase
MIRSDRITRRSFLTETAAAAGTAALFPTIVPAAVLGGRGRVSPSDKIAVGCIGVGPQGQGVMAGFLAQEDARVVAVCDVKKDQLDGARRRVNRKYENEDCAVFDDFRQLVSRKDIDVVLVATPDHWHALTTLAAVRSGKDVYCEKPLALSLAEHRALRREIRERGRVFQFGTMQRSDRKFRQACELVLNGRIGKLRHINVWAPGSAPGGSTRELPVPDGINYDFWLGPAPFKPYTEDRCSATASAKTWWFITDYTLGFVSGWGVHPIDIAAWGGGSEMFAGPYEIEGFGRIPTQGACNTATIWDVNFTFANGVTLKFVGNPNGRNMGEPTGEPWPQQQEWINHYGKIETHGTGFEGTEGWVYVDRSRLTVHPQTMLEDGADKYKVQLKRSGNHVRDFLDSVKKREKSICPIEDAIRADQLCHTADLAMRLHRKLVFDPNKEEFTDAEAQKRYAEREMRKPWTL